MEPTEAQRKQQVELRAAYEAAGSVWEMEYKEWGAGDLEWYVTYPNWLLNCEYRRKPETKESEMDPVDEAVNAIKAELKERYERPLLEQLAAVTVERDNLEKEVDGYKTANEAKTVVFGNPKVCQVPPAMTPAEAWEVCKGTALSDEWFAARDICQDACRRDGGIVFDLWKLWRESGCYELARDVAVKHLDAFFAEPEPVPEPSKPERWYCGVYDRVESRHPGSLMTTAAFPDCTLRDGRKDEEKDYTVHELIPIPLAEKVRELLGLHNADGVIHVGEKLCVAGLIAELKKGWA